MGDFNCICREDTSFTAVLSTCPGWSVVALESFEIAVKGLNRTAGFSFLRCGVAIILTGVGGHDFSGVCRIKKSATYEEEW